MKKNIRKFLLSSVLAVLLLASVSLVHGESMQYSTQRIQYRAHRVVTGDTLYKISLQYNANLWEIININKQISSPNSIYPGQVIITPDRTGGEAIKAPITTNNAYSEKSQEPSSNTNTSSVPSNVNTKEADVVKLVNIERAKYGLNPLSYNENLSKVARVKSQDMANNNYFDHTSPTYGDPFTMMKNFGIKYSYAGENIAAGQATAEAVMNGWMNSEGHRKNILSSNFTEIGVGYGVNKDGRPYWTQQFIRP